jgi:hypothetical protein
MGQAIGYRLEQYTIRHPYEVLLVSIKVNGEPDQIAIFKGFSSSLMRSTAYNPDIPVLPEDAEIVTIDRLESPFDPAAPRYIQQGLTLESIELEHESS